MRYATRRANPRALCNNRRMTTTADRDVRLTFNERLLVAVHRLGGRDGVSKYLEVNPSTVSRWTGGDITPRSAVLRAIATGAGVPFEWLRPSPEETGKGLDQYTPWDLNPEPTDEVTCEVIALLSEADSILRAVAVTA